jgi:hypothetical protein
MNPRILLVILVASFVVAPRPAAVRFPGLAPEAPNGILQSSLLDKSTPFENEWRITNADHFDITFTAITAGDLERIAATAERGYRHISAGLIHELSIRPLIVVYNTRADMQRAIAARSFPGNREHLLWSLDTPALHADGDFVHELTHIFAFDIVPVTVRRELPSWLHEGLAEFERGEWAAGDLGIVRDLLRANRFPPLIRLSAEGSTNAAPLQRIVGHLAFDFLVARAGQDTVKRILVSLRENVTSPIDAYLTAIGLTESQFEGEFERYVRTRFAA